MSQCLPIHAGPRDPQRRLLRSLIHMAGPDTVAMCKFTTSWASGLYEGTIYDIELEMLGGDAARKANALADMLPEAEFPISGHVVVSVSVDKNVAQDARNHRLHLTVLLIADVGD